MNDIIHVSFSSDQQHYLASWWTSFAFVFPVFQWIIHIFFQFDPFFRTRDMSQTESKRSVHHRRPCFSSQGNSSFSLRLFLSRPMCSSSCAFCHFSFRPKLIASRAQSVSNTSSTSILSQIDLVTYTVSLYTMSKSFRNGHRTKIEKGKKERDNVG